MWLSFRNYSGEHNSARQLQEKRNAYDSYTESVNDSGDVSNISSVLHFKNEETFHL